MAHYIVPGLLLTMCPANKRNAVQNKLAAEQGLHFGASPDDVPRTAMQEALRAGAQDKAQRQQPGVHASSLQQSASLEEARDKTAALSLSSGNSPSKSLGPRRVSFNVGSKDTDGPNSGCSPSLADSQSRAISLSELREVMRKMKFTRCLLPPRVAVLLRQCTACISANAAHQPRGLSVRLSAKCCSLLQG